MTKEKEEGKLALKPAQISSYGAVSLITQSIISKPKDGLHGHGVKGMKRGGGES